ncbi:hypothetical protein Cs7R123_32250 [Catellatospora sp. TT07R-123]|uniref:DUF2637 domain-containing protein n=1 Tax=Catellatospora sp. TT07R-123 TaxID=2733863 RepID=UPI001B091854|nr:DUF2637 domain-containing protein [Catellatospora sp. TT07R-123]GHJ45883.1 hypothetical protein Cs7R123_32250 [Catellatospora sp. TT07R-123]
MNATTLASRTSAAMVALVAGYSSFSHVAHVALGYGERPEVAYALPFAVDGLLVVATTAMLDDKRAGRSVRWSARLAFAFGVSTSLAANVASARPDTGARIVAAVPAIALLLAVEVLSRSGNPKTTAPAHAGEHLMAELPDGDDGQTAEVPQRPVAETAYETMAVSATGAVVAVAETATGDSEQLAEVRDEVVAETATAAAGRLAAGRDEVVAADDMAAVRPSAAIAAASSDLAVRVAFLAAGRPDIKSKAVADRLGIPERTARRYLAAVRAGRAGVQASGRG